MKFLVAGTGSIGRRHIGNIRQLAPECSFILLRTDARQDALAEELGAPVVSSLEQALSLSPDAILIATPSALHTELLLPAIAAGLPIYIEKPVVTTRDQFLAVEAAVARHSYRATTLVGCNLRYLPSLQLLQRLLTEGAIGQPVRASFEAGQWLPDWRPAQDHRQSYSADPARGGGVLMDLIHEIDAARWLLGALKPLATASAQVPALAIASEGVAQGLLRSEADTLVSIALDYVARRPLRRYQLVGDEGTLTWDLPARLLVWDRPEGREAIDCGEEGFDVAATYLHAMAEFLGALKGGTSTSQPLGEGLRSSELAITMKEQACP